MVSKDSSRTLCAPILFKSAAFALNGAFSPRRHTWTSSCLCAPDFCDFFRGVERTDEKVDSYSGSAAEPPPKENARIHASPAEKNFRQCVIRKPKHPDESVLKTECGCQGSVQIFTVFVRNVEDDARAGPNNPTSKHIDRYGNRKSLISESAGDLRCRNERRNKKTLARAWPRRLIGGSRKSDTNRTYRRGGCRLTKK